MHKNFIMFLEKGTKAWLSSSYIKDGSSGKIFVQRISRSKNSSKRFLKQDRHKTLHPSSFLWNPLCLSGFQRVKDTFPPFITLHPPFTPFFPVCYALNFPNFSICKSTVMNLFCQLRINLCSKLSNISSKLWDTSSKLSNISSKLSNIDFVGFKKHLYSIRKIFRTVWLKFLNTPS